MLFQPRGPVYLRKLTAALLPGLARQICPDAVSVNLKTARWSHTNKCGLVDFEDDGGINTLGAEVSMTFPTRLDLDISLVALGTVNAAALAATITDEDLPNPTGGIAAGDVYFLGGPTRHFAITGLALSKHGSPAGADLILGTNYTLEAATGKVTFLTAVVESDGPISAGYGYTDPKYISLLTATESEYALDMEILNRRASNSKSSLQLYRLRPDPVDNLDFMPDKEQSLLLKFQGLLDTSRAVDNALGQVGRMTTIEA